MVTIEMDADRLSQQQLIGGKEHQDRDRVLLLELTIQKEDSPITGEEKEPRGRLETHRAEREKEE